MKELKTAAEFDSEIGAGGNRLVLFYSGWCHFCNEFLPSFEKNSAAASGVFVKVCVDDLPAIEARFAVEVVPSVLHFKDGKLANRLDGVLGRGLTDDSMRAFAAACGIKTA